MWYFYLLSGYIDVRIKTNYLEILDPEATLTTNMVQPAYRLILRQLELQCNPWQIKPLSGPINPQETMERASVLSLYHWPLPHSARVLQGLVGGGGGSTCWRQDVAGWSSWRQGPGRGLIWAGGGGGGGGLSPADKPETMPGSRPLASSHHLHVGAIRALPGWAPAPVRLEAPLTTGGEYQRADDDRRWIRLYTTHQRHHHPSFDNLSKRLAWWRAGCMEGIQGVNRHYSFASLSLKAFSLKEPESVLSQRLDRWTIGTAYSASKYMYTICIKEHPPCTLLFWTVFNIKVTNQYDSFIKP